MKMNTALKYGIPLLTVIAILALGYFLLILPNMNTTPAPIVGSSKDCKIAYQPKVKKYAAYPPVCINTSKTYTALIRTNMGDMTMQLLAKDAPKTVNNFVFLAKSGFYDNLTFHRVIPSFVIQGGDPEGNGQGGPGYTFADEINPNTLGLTSDEIKNNESSGYSYNTSLHTVHITKSIVAMANSGPNTNGSQFFITLTDQPTLDGLYTPFAQVTSGMDVANTIANVQTDANNKPVKPVIIEKITIQEK